MSVSVELKVKPGRMQERHKCAARKAALDASKSWFFFVKSWFFFSIGKASSGVGLVEVKGVGLCCSASLRAEFVAWL